MIKSWDPGGMALVTFTIDAAVGASHVAICGEWNSWSPESDVMEPADAGGFSRKIELETGRTYRFRYLLDGHRWENDWAADSYLPNDHGTTDSVVDLTTLPEGASETSTEAPAKKSTPAKKAAAKKAASTKKAATTKKAAPAKKTTKKATD
jgi:1,4-alpha-glucan branching enzyme